MLEALARGLRAAGGVLSPNVSQQLAQEGLQDQVAERQMAMQMLQQRIADQREQALARAVGPALEGGDFEAAAKAAASSGAPGGTAMAMNLLGQAEARKARAEQLQTGLQMKALELRQRHLDKMDELRQKGADAAAMNEARLTAQREMAEFQANSRREMIRLMASLRQPPQPRAASPVTVMRDGKPVIIDANTDRVIGDAAPKPAPERSLPTSAIRELSETGGTAADFNRLAGSFQDGFGGFGTERVGDIDNWIKRNVTGDKAGQAQWWQDYQNQKNVIRNRLFGSALTATEKTEFDKAQINPGMRADEIRKNLTRQQESAVRAAKKLAGAYVKGGYSAEQIEAALGVPLTDLGIQRPSQTSGGAIRPADPLGIR